MEYNVHVWVTLFVVTGKDVREAGDQSVGRLLTQGCGDSSESEVFGVQAKDMSLDPQHLLVGHCNLSTGDMKTSGPWGCLSSHSR